MTFMRTTKRYLSIMLTALFMLTSLASIQAQAAMVGTGEAIAQQQRIEQLEKQLSKGKAQPDCGDSVDCEELKALNKLVDN